MTKKPDRKAIMNPITIAVTLLCISLLILAWFILGSFVTYTPSVDATAMQNIYLTRILGYGSAIAVLNVLAAATLLFGWDSRAKSSPD